MNDGDMTKKEGEALQRAYDEIKIAIKNKDSEDLSEQMYVATLRAAKAIDEVKCDEGMSILMNAYYAALVGIRPEDIQGVHTIASEQMTGFVAACLLMHLAEHQQYVCEMVREGGLNGGLWWAGDLIKKYNELFPGLSVNKS